MLTIDQTLAEIMGICDDLMDEYPAVSIRSVHAMIPKNLQPANVEEVIDYLAKEGWDYCLDPKVKMGEQHDMEYPPYFACHYGPDQLKSRIMCYR